MEVGVIEIKIEGDIFLFFYCVFVVWYHMKVEL